MGDRRIPPWFLFGAAALLLATAWVPPATAVAQDSQLFTFADGRTSATLHFIGPCDSNDTLGFRLPPNANVTAATLVVHRAPDSVSTRGVLRFDVGQNGLPETSATLSGNGTGNTNVSLSTGEFNAYLRGPNATSPETVVPLGIASCSFPLGWNVTFEGVVINYTVGSPSSAHAPTFAGAISNFEVAAGSTTDTQVFVPPLFSDADDDPLTFTVSSSGPNTAGANLRVELVGEQIRITAAAGWAGSQPYVVEARDPANLTALSNAFIVAVPAPDRPVVFAGTLGDLQVTSGSAARALFDAGPYFSDPNGQPLSFSVTGRDGSPAWAVVEFEMRGASLWLTRSGDSTFSGQACLQVRASDVNGSFADSNAFCIRFEPPPAAAAPVPVSITIDSRPSASVAPPGVHTLVAITDIPVPDGALVEWFLDGERIGTGERLEGVQLDAGSHTLVVRVTTGAASHELEAPVIVQAAAPSAPVKPASPPSEVTAFTAVVSLSLLGLAVSRVEVVRYFAVGGLLAGLFSRLRGESLLSHFTRGRLYQAIQEHPGIRFNELKRVTGVANGSAVHHLRVLAKGGFIRAVADGAVTRFYTTDSPLSDDEYGLLEADHDILTIVQAQPGLSVEDLAERIARSPSATSRAVSRLSELGYLRRERNGRRAALYPRLKAAP